MKTIYLEKDLFSEDERCDTQAIISKYFNIEYVDLTKALEMVRNSIFSPYFRGSLNVAALLGYRFDHANALVWASALRKHLLFPSETKFSDLDYYYNYYTDKDFATTFIRPVHGFKSFSGQVFGSRDKFIQEYNFMTKNKNISPDLLCMESPKMEINREYRCVFVNGKYVSGSLYMIDGKLDMYPFVPEHVINFATKLSSHTMFSNVFNFVIDVATIEESCYLLEVNAFETASFYASDLDKIYKALTEDPDEKEYE